MDFTQIYYQVDDKHNDLKFRLQQMEQAIDELCLTYVTTVADLDQLAAFNRMLNELYEELEAVQAVRGALYN